MAEASVGTRGIICGECGSESSVCEADAEPKPDDRVVCPVHGDIGEFEGISAEAFARFSERIGPSLRKALGVKSH
jgi:hypothetical protein